MIVYKLLKVPSNNEETEVGTLVYDLLDGEAGLNAGDTRLKGVEYTLVTLQEDGSSPGFSVPSSDAEILYVDVT